MRAPRGTRARRRLGSPRGAAAEAPNAAAQAERLAQTILASPGSWSWTGHPPGALQRAPAQVPALSEPDPPARARPATPWAWAPPARAQRAVRAERPARAKRLQLTRAPR